MNKILLGNCLELFKEIPDNSVNMTFADPPFNIKKKYAKYKDDLEIKQYLDWCGQWLSEMVRVTSPTGCIFVHNIPKWLCYYTEVLNDIADFKHWISWDSPTVPMGKTLQPNHYGILFYAKSAKDLKFNEIRCPHRRERTTKYLLKDYGGKKNEIHSFGHLVSDVWTDIHRIKHNKDRDEHPCQLPIHLLERIVLMSTEEGDTVLDPFSGTGTTAVAAKRLGRNYIGFELSEEYQKIAENKLTQQQPSKIGDCWVSYYRDNIITLRDKDWKEISEYYHIPKNVAEIDFTPIELKTDRSSKKSDGLF